MMDIDFAIDEINREQDCRNLLEAQLEAAEKRVAELEDVVIGLLDGLDSNYDERCGLTGKEWEQRIIEARRTLNK